MPGFSKLKIMKTSKERFKLACNIRLENSGDFEFSKWDNFEIHPCRVTNPGEIVEDVEQCDNIKDAHFFSVYAHQIEGGLCCLADCEDMETANALVQLLKHTTNQYS